MTFDRRLPSSSFAAQLQKSKLALSLSALHPQCRNTFGSLSVADCSELFMVSLSTWIPRRGRDVWAERSWQRQQSKSGRLKTTSTWRYERFSIRHQLCQWWDYLCWLPVSLWVVNLKPALLQKLWWREKTHWRMPTVSLWAAITQHQTCTDHNCCLRRRKSSSTQRYYSIQLC